MSTLEHIELERSQQGKLFYAETQKIRNIVACDLVENCLPEEKILFQ